MHEQIRSAEIDPWDEWLTAPSSQDCSETENPVLPLQLKPQQTSGLNEDWGSAARECENAEAWSVPSAEELQKLLAGLESDCQKSERTNLPVSESRSGCDNDQSDQAENVRVPTADSNLQTTGIQRTVPTTSVSPLNFVCTTLQSMDAELREAFMDDASSCMDAMEAAAMQLNQENSSLEATLQFSRQLHTLKGASASVGLQELADRLHELEEKIRLNQETGQPTSSQFLLESLDWLRSQLVVPGNRSGVNTGNTGGTPHHGPFEHGTGVISAKDNVESPPLESFAFESSNDDDSVRVKASQLNRLMDLLAGLVMLRNRRQTETTDLREVYHELTGIVSKLKLLSSISAKSVHRNECVHEHSHGDFPDSCLSSVTGDGSIQLSEIAADVQEISQRLRECTRPVVEGNEAVSLFIRQFRQELVELRRAPFNGLFQRLQRAVQDAGRAEGKAVRVECIGASSTVERSLQQRLYEPLLHIVRNAVCHGIECSDVRQQAGKDASGLITLEAIPAADLLTIEVRDDGAGLNYQAIRQRAIERGLLGSNYSPTETELAQFIFHPGFSTRQSANQQAGRGIGMDIVASTLSRLGGWIDVVSEAGTGTTIRLSVPLRSAIDHLMVFRCGTQYYALPLLAVRRAGAIDHQYPAVGLTELLAQRSSQDDESKFSLILDLETATDRNSASRQRQINLLVDEIVGPEEVVVRPLPALLKSHPYCSGATLGSAGQTILVLASRKLLSWLMQHEAAKKLDSDLQNQEGTFETDIASSSGNRLASQTSVNVADAVVLVVDDSVSSRKSVVRSLSRYPLRVLEASDGRQALQLLRSNRFAAIFSDLEMPHLDGLEFLAEVRSRDSQQSTPFTIISSRQEIVFKSKAESLGVTKYLPKPITDAALDSVLVEIPTFTTLMKSPIATVR